MQFEVFFPGVKPDDKLERAICGWVHDPLPGDAMRAFLGVVR